MIKTILAITLFLTTSVQAQVDNVFDNEILKTQVRNLLSQYLSDLNVVASFNEVRLITSNHALKELYKENISDKTKKTIFMLSEINNDRDRNAQLTTDDLNQFFKDVSAFVKKDNDLFDHTLSEETKLNSPHINKNYRRWYLFLKLLPVLPTLGVVGLVVQNNYYLFPATLVASLILYKSVKTKLTHIEEIALDEVETKLIHRYNHKWINLLKFSQKLQNIINKNNYCPISFL